MPRAPVVGCHGPPLGHAVGAMAARGKEPRRGSTPETGRDPLVPLAMWAHSGKERLVKGTLRWELNFLGEETAGASATRAECLEAAPHCTTRSRQMESLYYLSWSSRGKCCCHCNAAERSRASSPAAPSARRGARASWPGCPPGARPAPRSCAARRWRAPCASLPEHGAGAASMAP
ncbi:unnamed protein product, partial [Prorocentrum cordatum]